MIADPKGVSGYHGVDVAQARRLADQVEVVDGVALWDEPLTVDRHGRLHDGHHRALASRFLGARCHLVAVRKNAPPDSPEWATRGRPRLAVEDQTEHERITEWATAA